MGMLPIATVLADGRRREAKLATEEGPDARDQFIRLVERELDRAYRLAGLILGDAAEAEDAVQDALLRGWRGAQRLRNTADFQAWFDRILVNGCRDRLRRRRTIRFIALGPETDGFHAVDSFRQVIDRDEVLRAMGVLPADERIVFVLHYWADLTLEAVALHLDWPVGTVKSRLNRGLGRIRAKLGDSATDGEQR
jgi:RNA polymerase sigma-70 factor, ECF subfamily